MRKCNKCSITFSGDIDQCPLCQSELMGKKESAVFPHNIKIKKDKLLFKILSFATIFICLLLLLLEYEINGKVKLSIYAGVGLITNYSLTRIILKNFQNPLKMMTRYFALALLLLVIWYLLIKSLIITTYLIPILCIVIVLFNSITILVLGKKYIKEYIKYMLVDILIGFIPIVFLMLKLTTNNFVVIISIFLNIVFFFGLFIFCNDEIKSEIEKIFTM